MKNEQAEQLLVRQIFREEEFGIEKAIYRACACGPEPLAHVVERVTEILGKLVAALHESGKLSDSEVTALLGAGFELVEKEEKYEE